ncbi:uncharacterized protein fit [Drosophila tropicalis]|uniref:uncharacterized protein fit n=1 Tax=Drosophila tropicalis TaxID=46794 RepID=UPI0035ABBF58
MRSVLVAILILGCGLALTWAGTLRPSEDYSTEDRRPSWTHRHSSVWPCDVADYPEAYVLMHKVEKRLERIDNDQLKNRIVQYVTQQLRQCKSGQQMDEHCVKRSIGYAMSFINHHKENSLTE